MLGHCERNFANLVSCFVAYFNGLLVFLDVKESQSSVGLIVQRSSASVPTAF